MFQLISQKCPTFTEPLLVNLKMIVAIEMKAQFQPIEYQNVGPMKRGVTASFRKIFEQIQNLIYTQKN